MVPSDMATYITELKFVVMLKVISNHILSKFKTAVCDNGAICHRAGFWG